MEQRELVKRSLPFIIAFLMLAGIAVVIYLAVQKNTVSVTRLDDATKNLPSEKRDSIRQAIDMMIAKNNNNKSATDVNDIVVREGSISQQFGKENNVYTGSFLVDSESLRQTYKVTYSYSSIENSTSNTGYPVLVTCPSASELKYGAFDCKEVSIEQPSKDPLLSKLPYRTDFYTINSSTNVNGLTRIIVQIMITTTGERTRSFFNEYKVQANAWIESQGVKLSDYAVEYRNLSNEIVE